MKEKIRYIISWPILYLSLICFIGSLIPTSHEDPLNRLLKKSEESLKESVDSNNVTLDFSRSEICFLIIRLRGLANDNGTIVLVGVLLFTSLLLRGAAKSNIRDRKRIIELTGEIEFNNLVKSVKKEIDESSRGQGNYE